MKKTISHITTIFLLLILISGCNSNDESIPGPTETEELINLSINNEQIQITSWEATKSGDFYILFAKTDDDRMFGIFFNEKGILSTSGYSINLTNPSSSQEFESSRYYSSESFEITNININGNRVNLNFYGTLYDSSDFIPNNKTITVNPSSFSINFKDITPDSYIETYHTATINNQLFEHSKKLNSTSDGNFSLVEISEGPEVISIHFDRETSTVGTYDFNSDQDIERISFKTVDPYIPETNIYQTAGTFTILEISRPVSENHVGIIKGTYEFIAASGNEMINVTNGNFNLIF